MKQKRVIIIYCTAVAVWVLAGVLLLLAVGARQRVLGAGVGQRRPAYLLL